MRVFDEQFLGLNIGQWMHSLRGRILVRLGRFAEARACLDELLAIEQSLLDPAVRFIPHLAYVDMAYFRGDAALASEHAMRVSAIAQRGRSPYLKVYDLGCSGAASIVAGDHDAGIDLLKEGVECTQQTRAALEFEPEMLATLADGYYLSGRFEEAMKTAHRGVEIAKERGARIAECRSLVILAAAASARGGTASSADVMENSLRARELVQVTGADVVVERLILA